MSFRHKAVIKAKVLFCRVLTQEGDALSVSAILVYLFIYFFWRNCCCHMFRLSVEAALSKRGWIFFSVSLFQAAKQYYAKVF